MLALLGLFSAQALGQAYQIDKITTTEGLSQGFVQSLHEDSRGFIWIGTKNGLNRYDGYSVKRFVPDPLSPWSLRASSINSITEDARGLLWLGTDKGLIAMDPYTNRFVELEKIQPDIPDAEVLSVAIDAGGRVWFSMRIRTGNSLFFIENPKDFLSQIRSDNFKGSDFRLQQIELQAGVQAPIQRLFFSEENRLMGVDFLNTLCRAAAKELVMRPVQAGEVKTVQSGNYSVFYLKARREGVLFQAKNTAGKDLSLNDAVFFLQQADGQKILLSAGTKKNNLVKTLDILSKHDEKPSVNNMRFFDQFPTLVELDKPIMPTSLIDQNGDIWIGTNGYGLRILRPGKNKFIRYAPNSSIYNFTLLPDGNIWPGIFNAPNLINTRSNSLQLVPWLNKIPNGPLIYSLFYEGNGEGWAVGCINNERLSLYKYLPDRDQWLEIPSELEFIKDKPLHFLQDRKGQLWLAGNNGEILRIDPRSGRKEEWNVANLFKDLLSGMIYSNGITASADGNIWIATNQGLLKISNADAAPKFQVQPLEHLQGNATVAVKDILCVHADKKMPGVIWLGTRGNGLCRLDTRNGSTENYAVRNGLADNVVYGILQDARGFLWMSTNRGISTLDPFNKSIYYFFTKKFSINTEFNSYSYRELPGGKFAFGSIQGLFVFDPLEITRQKQPSRIVITDIKVNGYDVDPTTEGSKVSINENNEFRIQLSHDENNVSVSFAAMPVSDPYLCEYRYRINGKGASWVRLGSQNNINLASLAAGKYQIEIQASTLETDWEASPGVQVELIIMAPWYNSTLAWVIYLLVAGGIAYFLWAYKKNQLEQKHQTAIMQKEAERLRSLDDLKNRFFSYVTHEFKTPLTIILGLTEQMERQAADRNSMASIKQGIQQQTRNILELVDQLIDLGRSQEKVLQLQLQQSNVSEYIQYLVESLRPLAEFREIKLTFRTSAPELVMDFDPLRTKYILVNLITNAIRHTQNGGAIQVELEKTGDNRLSVKVTDNGEGIDPKDLPHIFDTYFRGKSKSGEKGHFGIGLSFVKHLVELFNGEIKVESVLGEGTSFTMLLPVSNTAPRQSLLLEQTTSALPQESDAASREGATKDLPIVLIVEDNPVITAYLISSLKSFYRVLAAPDGQKGLELALEHLPDVIVTDLVMPGMDGYELTRQIKTHELTNHIPVLMLSARAGLEDRLAGREHGVDVVLPKPFNEKELIMILQNLIALKQRWKERYTNRPQPVSEGREEEVFVANEMEELDKMALSADPFIRKLYAAFEEHFSSDSFDRDELCSVLLVSRSQLQRKVAAVSDLSAMELLRLYRLQRAYKMLEQDPELHVKEVCFRCGFKNVAHFSNLFSKTYNIKPTQVKKR